MDTIGLVSRYLYPSETMLPHAGVDVYKRQGQMHLFLLRSGPNRERMERLIAYCRARGAVCLTIDCGADRPGAVSYTHLDVYKRQAWCTGSGSSLVRNMP